MHAAWTVTSLAILCLKRPLGTVLEHLAVLGPGVVISRVPVAIDAHGFVIDISRLPEGWIHPTPVDLPCLFGSKGGQGYEQQHYQESK